MNEYDSLILSVLRSGSSTNIIDIIITTVRTFTIILSVSAHVQIQMQTDTQRCTCAASVSVKVSSVAKSDASFWDQSSHRGCSACPAFSDYQCPDPRLLLDQEGSGLAVGAQILDAAAAVAVVSVAAA